MMNRTNLPQATRPRSSVAWLFLILVPVAIVLIHFDVLSFGTQPDSKIVAPLENSPAGPVQPLGVADAASNSTDQQTTDRVTGDGDNRNDEEEDEAVAKAQRKLLVGSDVATETHTCESDKHAVDDDGKSCMTDLEYKLFRSVIYVVDRPNIRYMVCAIPKNGCTYHLALINRIYGEENFESTGVVHDVERKKLYKLSTRGTEKAAQMLANSSIPKYAVVRNPLQRTMSAYLNKVEAFLPEKDRTVESFHAWVYREFPKGMPLDRSWKGMNPHWLPQMQFCGFSVRDVHSYFKIFRVEEPADYVSFIYKHVPKEYLENGWSQENNLSFHDYVLGPRERTEGTSEKFLKYFNDLEVFDHVVRVLDNDINAFGYQEDVKRLRESVKNRINMQNEDEGEELD